MAALGGGARAREARPATGRGNPDTRREVQKRPLHRETGERGPAGLAAGNRARPHSQTRAGRAGAFTREAPGDDHGVRKRPPRRNLRQANTTSMPCNVRPRPEHQAVRPPPGRGCRACGRPGPRPCVPRPGRTGDRTAPSVLASLFALPMLPPGVPHPAATGGARTRWGHMAPAHPLARVSTTQSPPPPRCPGNENRLQPRRHHANAPPPRAAGAAGY